MIAEPNRDIWRTPKMQKMLEQRLQESYDAYQDTVRHMEDIMKRNAKDLRVDHSERANRSNLEALLKTNTRADSRFEFKRRAKFAMSGRRMKNLLDDLDECNKELERFTDKSERLVPYRKQSKSSLPTPLNQVRTYAKGLYSVLCIGGNCHASHRARLRLERRTRSSKSSKYVTKEVEGDPCFTVSLLMYSDNPNQNSTRAWREMQIQVITTLVNPPIASPQKAPAPGTRTVGFSLPPNVPQNPLPGIDQHSLQELKNICSSLRQAQSDPACLRFCLDKQGKLREVYPVAKEMNVKKGTITLKDILGMRSLSMTNLIQMSRKECMNLAVTLSSSYLQFQATPWLKDTWGKEDILFDGDINTTSIRPFDVEQPYICHEFKPPAAPASITHYSAQNFNPALPGNPSLLSLGILLLELYTGQTFEQYCSRLGTDNGPQLNDYYTQLHNLDAASKWLNAAQEDLSAGYMGAVLHCIRSFFDPITTEQDDAVFRQSTYEQVIVPLQYELNCFLGEGRRA